MFAQSANFAKGGIVMETPLFFALRCAPRYLTAACLLAGAAICFVGCQRGVEEPKPTFLNWASDPLLVENFYSQRSRMVANAGADGAVGVNREWQSGNRSEFFIEQQRYGADLIVGGLVSNQQNLIDEGIRVLDWGFARQGPGGDFPGTGDPMHSTSFMVEAAARSALVLEAPGAEEYRAKIGEWKPKILAAARWMAKPEEIERGRASDLEPFTHRYYLRAAALAQAAKLTGDTDLQQRARTYLEEGLSHQLENGTNPERGGFDASYQAVGIYYAQLAWLAIEDSDLRSRLEGMMSRALDPVIARVQADGAIDTSDSSRAQESGRSGQPKKVAYRSIIPAFLNYAKISGDPRYSEFAAKVAAHAWR